LNIPSHTLSGSSEGFVKLNTNNIYRVSELQNSDSRSVWQEGNKKNFSQCSTIRMHCGRDKHPHNSADVRNREFRLAVWATSAKFDLYAGNIKVNIST